MENIREILQNYIKKYPHSESVDLLKLIYQNVFGPAHLIFDVHKNFEYLKEELSGIEHKPQEYIEYIGGGYCRVHLHIVKDKKLSIETYHKLFVLAAKELVLHEAEFRKKVCECEDILNISYENAFKDDEIKPFSHSQKYKNAYNPSYRVVKREYCEFLPLLSKIDELILKKSNVIIAIDGNCGAGKTTLASLLKEIYDCDIISMDHFFLPQELRTNERLCEIGGNIDYDRFLEDVLCKLNATGFSYKKYKCDVKQFVGEVKIDKKIVVVDGSYSMHPKFEHVYDIKVFLSVDYDEQLKRIEKRNGIQMKEVFQNTYIPMENRYFQKFLIREKSDFLFDTTK